ncbi:pyridoxal phosphate-dependent aminotransferase [Desulfoluna spongiiphila]|uniref:pyridoxal phosphate-dependent aminotransferase n=1 Tax=Desulfoluna spongiiphila TaxID=419481 RepID=UPI00125B067A|nr:pyridoxal phosphate-dependent aminotransferase [Desulfoluna spongiiphila]VVS92833.1 pyridoxal phosphate-dependent transferase [Desulfoluna spongiiphila]
MTISTKIKGAIEKSSFIRKMFEEGARLKAEHGADKVYDFSLGNPYLAPPAEFKESLMKVAASSGEGIHSYMPNTGYPFVREAVAGFVSEQQGVTLDENDIVMTCGAAGALNVVLKTLMDPGDEVICPAPYFVEYNFYADNHRGVVKTVQTNPDFTLDLDAIEEAVCEKTKAVLINTPNNPTGQVYDKASLDALGDLLARKSRDIGHPIVLISDEPYRKITYVGISVPSIMTSYPNSVVVTSYSKDISIPGERIGYIAIHPDFEGKGLFLGGLALCNRILGYVNAPAIMQRVIAEIQGVNVDMTPYEKNRQLLVDGLTDAGYEFTAPKGAFYLFPKSPIENDVAFVRELQEELILVVPGSGFAGPGHFRISFCVDAKTITGALPGFARVMKKYK